MIVEYETGIVVRITEREGPIFHVQVIAPEPAWHWGEWRGLTVRVGHPIELREFVRGAPPYLGPIEKYCGAIVARIRPRG